MRRLVVVIVLFGAAPVASRGAEVLALTGGVVIDGSGAAPRPATLVVEGERIRALLAPGAALPPEARAVDVSGRTLIPGLIDACVRLVEEAGESPAAHRDTLAELLASGVTTVRVMDAPLAAGLALRQAVAAGALSGPRLLLAGPALDPAEGAEAEALRGEVETQARAGVDAILHGPGANREALRIAIAESARHGLPVLGRLRRTPWTFAARDRIGMLLGPAPWSIYYAQPRDRERIRSALHRRGETEARLEWLGLVDVDSEEMRRLRRWLRRRRIPVAPLLSHQLRLLTREAETPEAAAAVTRLAWPRLAEHVARLHAAGIALVAGSGAGPAELAAGGGVVSELQLMSLAGLTPLQAITAATGGAASALGLSDAGRLAPGYRADVVVLESSPLADLAALRRVVRVLVGGREWKPGAHVARSTGPAAGSAPEAGASGRARRRLGPWGG
jgi:imidazolonepropionase-like amidohydrolase